ncbi:MAG: class I SAM-dependent methyltransferase [Chloroflexota bacterium]
MDLSTANQLVELNRQFYQTFARSFSATRQRLQPGVWRIVEELPAGAAVLDLGCGNGELGRVLLGRGHTAGYTGVDFAPALLDARRESAGAPPGTLEFVEADLAAPGWQAALPGRRFAVITLFAVLHHLPGAAARQALLDGAGQLLLPGGRLELSCWQFLNSPRLRQRIQPWQAAGIDPATVDPGDYLLDWRQDGAGLRYVHHFDDQELTGLAAAAGFQVSRRFHADGEGGQLSIYHTWQRLGPE